MLYILSIFYGLSELLPFESILIQNLIIKMPILISDLLIYFLLLKFFPRSQKNIIIIYFISPIVIYAAFMHSQLDIIPTAFLFYSIYMLTKKRFIEAGILFGCAFSTKHHVIIALPLILVYIFRNYRIKEIISFFIPSLFIIILTIIPFISSLAFYQLVFNNPKQLLIFKSFIQIGEMKLILPVFSSGILYLIFSTYNK